MRPESLQFAAPRARTLAIVILLGVFPVLRAETFTNPPFLPTGTNPGVVLQADFNGDGKPDLFYMNMYGAASFDVLLGNGDGTFGTPLNTVLPAGFTQFLAVADVNHDGKPDLIFGAAPVVLYGPQQPAQIGVMLGNGDGTFQPAIVTSLPTNTSGMHMTGATGDFNGDGALDLIIAGTQGSGIYVLLGNNTGSFTAATVSQQVYASSVFVGDFNGDSREDFLVSTGAGVAVFLGNGDGTFQPPVASVLVYGSGSLLLADMDGDGHPDLLALGATSGLSIYHGNPDGSFNSNPSGGTSDSGTIEQLVGVADFNGDGILDVVGAGSNGVIMLLGKGNLAYALPAPYAAGPSPPSVAMGDFNLDGHEDFAVCAPGGIALLFGNADGSLQSAPTFDLGTGAGEAVVADFNGDGKTDIAVNTGTTTPLVMFGQGGGKFLYNKASSPNTNGGFTQMLAGDFNGDGKLDLLLADANFLTDSVLYGTGAGTFRASNLAGLAPGGLSPAGVADLNHDGLSDIVVQNEVLLGQKNNTFSTETLAESVTLEPVFDDFNRDGKLDMVTMGDNGLQVMLGNGDGTFQAGHTLPTQVQGSTYAYYPVVLATGDFDGDGKLDIAVLVSAPQVAEVFYGNGDGTFDGPSVLPLSLAYLQMASADVNGDGLPDLVFSDGNIISIIHNDGQRYFGPEVHYLAGTVGSFVVQDVNGDGLPDIVVSNGVYATSLVILLNQAGGLPVTGTLSVSPEPSSLGQPFTITLKLQALRLHCRLAHRSRDFLRRLWGIRHGCAEQRIGILH